MIRNISYELVNKTQPTTDILVKFKDKGITKDFYDFIKDQLENFKLDIIPEYSITLDSECDCYKEILIIEIVLSIPDLHKPLDEDLEQIINHLSYKFTKFYERRIQIFKNKSGINKLKETKKCPNCNYECIMECWKAMAIDEIYCKCPNCKFTFGNPKK